MRQRGKKLELKRTVNMSFSELVQRIVQKEMNGSEPGLEKPKRKKTTSELPRVERNRQTHFVPIAALGRNVVGRDGIKVNATMPIP